MQTKNLELIKQKIIKTDEVLKIYVEKRNQLSEQSTKYDILLNKYREKCKEFEKLKNEKNKYQFNYDQYKKAIQFEQLYNELSKSYTDLEKNYGQHVNNSEIKYQKVNQELEDSANKQIQQSKTIEHLQNTIKKLKSKVNEKSLKIEEKTQNLETDNINLKKCISKLELEKEELNGKITDLMLEINLLNNSDRFAPKEYQERSTQTEIITADDIETDNFFVNYFFKTVTNTPKLLSPIVTSSDTNEDADFDMCSPLFEDTQTGNEIFFEHIPKLSDEINCNEECLDNEPDYTQITDIVNDENSIKNICEDNVKNIIIEKSPNVFVDFSHKTSLPEICNLNSEVFCSGITNIISNCDTVTECSVNDFDQNNIDYEVIDFDEGTQKPNVGKDDFSESINLNDEKTSNTHIEITEQNTNGIRKECDFIVLKNSGSDETTKTVEVNNKEELNLQDNLCNKISNIKQIEENIKEIEDVSCASNKNCLEFTKRENKEANEKNSLAKAENFNFGTEMKVCKVISESKDIDKYELQILIDEMKFTKPMLSPLSSESEEELEANASFHHDHSRSKICDEISLQNEDVLVGDNCTEMSESAALNESANGNEIVCDEERTCTTSQEILTININKNENSSTLLDDNIDIMSLPIIFVNNLQDMTELENCIFDDKSCIILDSITDICENNEIILNNNKPVEERNKTNSANSNKRSNTSKIQENEMPFENGHQLNSVVNLKNEQISHEKSTEQKIAPIKRKLPQTNSKTNKKPRKVSNDSKNIVNNINMRKQIKTLFIQMLNFTSEPLITIEIANKLKEFDQVLILDEIFLTLRSDYFEKLNMKYTPPAPPLTVTQQVILGLMLKLVKLNMKDLLDKFLIRAERIILTEKQIQCFIPVTRMYVAICKIQQNLQRVRRLCFDALYFMGDLVVPFLFCVLTSWTEVLPTQNFSADNVLVKVLLQVVNLKTCNKPGYNLLNLRNFLNGYYKYPKERWNTDEIIAELVEHFKVKPTKELEYGILIICKNLPTKWVCEQIQKHLKPLIYNSNNSNKIIELISKIMLQFNNESDHCSIGNIKS